MARARRLTIGILALVAALLASGSAPAGATTAAASCVVEIGPSANIEVAGDAQRVTSACGDLLASTFDGRPAVQRSAPAGVQRCQVQAGAVRYTVRETAPGDQVATLYCYVVGQLPNAHRL
jgi:hypothetical protein